jgi:hypothetical protein
MVLAAVDLNDIEYEQTPVERIFCVERPVCGLPETPGSRDDRGYNHGDYNVFHHRSYVRL